MKDSCSVASRRPPLATAGLGALALLLVAGSVPEATLRILEPTVAGGRAHVEIQLGPAYVEGTLRVQLDREPVEASFVRTASGAVAVLPAASGAHQLKARARFESPRGRQVPRQRVRRFTSPPGAPALLTSDPAPGAEGVSRASWIRLHFAAPLAAETRASFALSCEGSAQRLDAHVLAPDSLVVNPTGELPGGAECELAWQAPDGPARLGFATAPAGPPATVRYDRRDLGRSAPFPDDFWLVADPSTATGQRVEIAVPEREQDVRLIFAALLAETRSLDGFSPLPAIVVELSDAPDPASLPLTPTASLDPLASVGLFDLTPGSATLGARVAFQVSVRSETLPGQATSHALVLHPSIPLTPGGRYGFVVTRRAGADPGRPFDPSAFLRAALSSPEPGEAEEVARVRALAGEVLAEIARVSPLPLPADDVALALRISVRTTDGLPDDLRSIKQQVLALPPPLPRLEACTACACGVEPGSGDVAAFVTGEWEAPSWRENLVLARDGSGAPRITGMDTLCFTLALPEAASEGPVPLTMYQHGNPGSEREVRSQAQSHLAPAGFAVAGFTDPLNREVGQDSFQQVSAIILFLLATQRLPDFWNQTYADQIAFLRLIEGLDAIDVLPLGSPDGVPEVDPGAPLTYLGISQGSNHGQALFAYAPEIRAGALVVGATRLGEILFYQDSNGQTPLLGTLAELFPGLIPVDVWVGLSLFQMIFDGQDPHNHAAFIYRQPVEVAGTTRKPSILVTEGLNDLQVTNNSTRSLAWTLGPIPHVEPVRQPVPFLEPQSPPLSANVDAETTAGFVQYVPEGVEGIPPEPDCVGEPNGHYCANRAAESRAQRVIFFQSAVTDPAPTIVDPF